MTSDVGSAGEGLIRAADSKSVHERRVYGARVPLAPAGPMSLLVVGVASATALLPRLRQGQVAWRIAGVFGAAGAAAAFAGAAVNGCSTPGCC